jgi:F0F1-type ATP synthase delta subunit
MTYQLSTVVYLITVVFTVVIRTEDTVIDDSVRGKLQKLAGTLQ